MPRFGQTWFNGYYFGEDVPVWTRFKTSIRRIPLGTGIRKQLGKEIIFRVRRGNGVGGSVYGKLYQDKYKYFVPSSINNAEGQPARNALIAAVSNWKNVLTTEQKEEYNQRATESMRMSGYNLYVREYIKANI